MIRVGFLDDHPAVRIGIESILDETPDLVSVGGAGSAADLLELIESSSPDVVLLDYHHPGHDGLELSIQIKSKNESPRIVLYSAQRDVMLVAATLAGVDGIVGKASDASRLPAAIRAVAGGGTTLPDIGPGLKRRAAGQLDPADHTILSMRVAGNSRAEIADTLWLGEGELRARIAGMIRRLMRNGLPAATPTLSFPVS